MIQTNWTALPGTSHPASPPPPAARAPLVLGDASHLCQSRGELCSGPSSQTHRTAKDFLSDKGLQRVRG